MGKIQDIHALEQCIYDIVQDYIDDCYTADDVLAISKKGNKIVVTADAREKIVRNSTTEIYPLENKNPTMTQFRILQIVGCF